MVVTEVAQAGMTSNSHIRAAKTNIAMVRCWMTVSPSMPNESIGKTHNTMVINKITIERIVFFISKVFSIEINFYLFHYKFQRSALQNLLMRELVVFYRFPVDFHTLHMNLFRRFIWRYDRKIFAIFEMQNCLFK